MTAGRLDGHEGSDFRWKSQWPHLEAECYAAFISGRLIVYQRPASSAGQSWSCPSL
jgi:hypothetical protein